MNDLNAVGDLLGGAARDDVARRMAGAECDCEGSDCDGSDYDACSNR
jgi:hypothetical protein